jgi:L-arabinose isomerase
MDTIKVGLLPLYLKLYDDTLPERRPGVERFLDTIAGQLRARNLHVFTAPVCRMLKEVTSAVHSFEADGVDAIVTLHLAYSPSEESAPVLAATALPVIVLDTTPAYDFSPTQSPDEVMYNHGIHGVQDLCNLLLRHGKAFHIEAGHWEHSDVLDRVVQDAQSTRMANAMRRARVGRIGNPFRGMGDFAVPESLLARTTGATVVPATPQQIGARLASISQQDIDAEWAADAQRFDTGTVTEAAYQTTARVCLAVRQWMERERLTGFTVNFMEANRAAGLPTMPFLEASKAMARGVGYAGEGDCLTAALVGALASVFPQVSFTEMFCPDWAHDAVFLSHMGEMNVDMIAGQACLIQKPYSFIDIDDPVLAVGRFKAGVATYVNLAPGPAGTYTLIVTPVMVQDVEGRDAHAGDIRGWIKPPGPLAAFLARYSRLGGTHHSALIMGDAVRAVSGFGDLMNWRVVEIPDEE